MVLNSKNTGFSSPATKVSSVGLINVLLASTGPGSPSLNPPVNLTGNEIVLFLSVWVAYNLYLSPLGKYCHFFSFSSLFCDLQTLDNLVRTFVETHNLTSVTTISVATFNSATSVLLVTAFMNLSKKKSSKLGRIETGKTFNSVLDISLSSFLSNTLVL